MNDCKAFRLRSGSGPRCRHRGLRGETSQPGIGTPAGALHPDLVRMLLRTSASVAISAGSASRPSDGIVCPAPRVWSLTLRVAFSLSVGRPPGGDLPLFGSYCDSAVIAGLPAPSDRIAQSATVRVPFHAPVATPERCSGRVGSFKTAGSRTPTLAHSSNSSVFGNEDDRLCALQDPKPRITGASLGLRLVCSSRATCWIASRAEAARRLTSWSLTRGGTTLPEEAGDMWPAIAPSIEWWRSSQGPGTPVRPDRFPGSRPGLS